VQTYGRLSVEDKATATDITAVNDGPGGFRCTRCSKPPRLSNYARVDIDGSSASSGHATPPRNMSRLLRSRRGHNADRSRSARSHTASPRSESADKSKSLDAEEMWKEAQDNTRPFMNGFQLTPMETIQASLLEAMELWNMPRLPNLCCPWHMSIWTASVIVNTFWAWECRPLWGPRSAWQCLECLAMNEASQEECDVCAGPRTASSVEHGLQPSSESSRHALRESSGDLSLDELLLPRSLPPGHAESL